MTTDCVKAVKNEMNQSETTGAFEAKYIKATWSKQEAIIIIIIIITINIIIVVVVVAQCCLRSVGVQAMQFWSNLMQILSR